MSTTCGGVGRDLHASLFQRLSIAFPSECPSSVPQFGGFEYSSNTGRTGFLSDENLHFKDFVFEEPCEAQTLTSQEGLQTPNVRIFSPFIFYLLFFMDDFMNSSIRC